MESNYADYLSMLLSADWFAPYWSALQLSIEPQKGAAVRKECQKVVEGMISGASEYFHVAFSEERVQRTRADLLGALRACGVDATCLQRIDNLIDREQASAIDDATAWLVVMLTGMLLRDSPPDGTEPEPSVRAAITRIGKHCELAREMNYQEICLSSVTTWDEYLRGLTPNQPTMLADHLSSIQSRDKFERLWASLHRELGNNERITVVSWYKRAARGLTGDELRLPTYH